MALRFYTVLSFIKKMSSLAAFYILAACQHPPARKLPYYNSPDFAPHFEKEVPDTYHCIRPFSLMAHTGTAFTEKNMNGKITVTNFFFTICPGICPRMTNNMKLLQDTFFTNKEVQLLSYSVTPDKDNVATLNAYAQLHHINQNKWLLLTGNKNEIYNLGRKFYFVEEDLGENRDTSIFLHTENFILTDKKRHIRGIYNGLSVSAIQSLIEDIRDLEKE